MLQPAQHTSTSAARSSTPVKHIPTQEAYDQWADVYDTDGNMLQSIDDHELETLLPRFLTTVAEGCATQSTSGLSLIDLGCGTGRNTAKLLSYAWPQDFNIEVTALDFSRGMLELAATKLNPASSSPDGKRQLRLEQCDCFPTVSDPSASPVPPVPGLTAATALISTLVLEHIPLKDYFATLAALVRTNGYALVTNMHSDMGRVSQAGFVNAEGVKVRATSFVYTPGEAANEARRAGFEVVDVRERGMREEDVESGVVGGRGRKWVGVMVWFALVLRRCG
ncbi:S-adenosyl-L-methionine-dependent methyltransferase [Sporormia fimetaria CBS 119925]|uniref:S-adenosyl-L-methionine-dependent methyltransferase n=1 Tax=Sporormia fimetaria CBS 119925 TaxID=1340428 RepID=A0A6A6UXD5_9PLEO|nr:S-adenosyl-L-methionine-dependent methyltransferase [Sporormia fimetaria CBS 119925]